MSLLLKDLAFRAAATGLNLCGAADTARFDASQCPDWRAERLQQGCGTIVVLGSGGPTFWQQMVRQHGAPKAPQPNYHPVQAFAVQGMRELITWLQAAGVTARLVQPEDACTLNFVQLGEAAGLGTVSPVIHLLLHPQFGPWVSLRGALLVVGKPFGEIADASLADSWQPCCGCPKPCVAACPAGVHDGAGGSDYHRCATHRHAGNCEVGCSVRRACPVGAEHRYPPDEEAHRHAYSLFAMRKWYGLGKWALVPRFLRG
ncbi:MAG TPA: hypothetical protein VK348_12200 [Planctomycetota bacterium]|nr:hypothetical protein [Planctomycetota bacterium]